MIKEMNYCMEMTTKTYTVTENKTNQIILNCINITSHQSKRFNKKVVTHLTSQKRSLFVLYSFSFTFILKKVIIIIKLYL